MKISANLTTSVVDPQTTKRKYPEANIIVFLYNSKIAININKLQSEVWGYHSELETHTVETHIYRLRKKLLEKFKDNKFIQSNKNGYQIN